MRMFHVHNLEIVCLENGLLGVIAPALAMAPDIVLVPFKCQEMEMRFIATQAWWNCNLATPA